MTALLASVANLAEAHAVLAAGADLIDLKDPRAGALGALTPAATAAIVQAIGGRRPLSATIGDLPMVPERVSAAVQERVETGVDYVKIGFFPNGDPAAVIAALTPLTRTGARLIAVLFGDLEPDLGLVPRLAAAGFSGVMLDTADKQRGTLRNGCPVATLRALVRSAREQGLLVGLAGSLTAADVVPLLALAPDFLGFRGALCGGRRTATIDPAATRRLVALVRESRAVLPR